MLSLLIKTFEQILKNGEQIQNVENFFKMWISHTKYQTSNSIVYTLKMFT